MEELEAVRWLCGRVHISVDGTEVAVLVWNENGVHVSKAEERVSMEWVDVYETEQDRQAGADEQARQRQETVGKRSSKE